MIIKWCPIYSIPGVKAPWKVSNIMDDRTQEDSIYGFSSSVKQYYLNMYVIDCSIANCYVCHQWTASMCNVKSRRILTETDMSPFWLVSSLAARDVVRMPSSSAAEDGGFVGAVTRFQFRWCVMWLEPLLFVFNLYNYLYKKKRSVSNTGVEETKCR